MIVKSILDTDLYKFTTSYAYMKLFPHAIGTFEFFDIGTNLTNDTGHKPSNIVMKLTSCQMNKNQPVFNCVKLSDDLGKHTGLEQEVEHCMNELGL